jgi:hypothetical protein
MLVIERGLQEMPFENEEVTTPTNEIYHGKVDNLKVSLLVCIALRFETHVCSKSFVVFRLLGQVGS